MSAGTDIDTDIKYIEEGLDYDKSPKPLIYLKITIGALFVILVALSAVQFGVNNQRREANLSY